MKRLSVYLLLLLVVTSGYYVTLVSGDSWGYDTIGGTTRSIDNDRIFFDNYTFTSPGENLCTNITAYLSDNGAAATVKMAIYDSGTNLVGESIDVTFPRVNAWYTFPLEKPVLLQNGTYYLAIWCNLSQATAPFIHYDAASQGFIDDTVGLAYPNFPNQINTTINPSGDRIHSFYGNFTQVNYVYRFSDTYYENGTLYVPPVDVTAIGSGLSETFNISGGYETGYTTQPTLFTWDAGSGVNRRIYTRTGISENYTITMPDGTFSVYEFTIRDYVGAIGNTPVYIESLRYINGTQTLIERAIVEDQINGVGLSLVLYKLYTIRLRYGSTTFDYDFVPGVDATPVLQLRDFTFTQRAQNINGYVTIEAQRNQTTGTNITGSYVDSRNNTVLVEFIIQLLNGTQVYYVNSTSANVVFTWNVAVNITDYKAIFRVNHTDFTGIRQAAFVLPGLRNYDALPSLDLIGDFGGINGTHIIGAILILIVAGIFSEKYIVAGGITLIVVAGVLNTVGLLDLTSIQLTSAIIAAVLVGVAVWRRRG